MTFRMLRSLCVLLWVIPAIAQTHENRALLIGINTYRVAGDESSGGPHVPGKHAKDSRFSDEVDWTDLHGPLNDVTRMDEVLTKRFGFTVVKLLDRAATREGILTAIQNYVIDQPQPGDTVLFYFAGHGSLRVNSKSRKVSQFDETIVPADAHNGAFDIRDKELARLFNKALDKKITLIAVFDSCHSGTMARGWRNSVSRSLPYDDRDAADPEDYGASPAERGAIIISAALSTQDASEIDRPLPQAHGVFTSAFVKALNNATYGWTALDLLESTSAYLKADDETQQPSIEGPRDRGLFTSLTIKPRIRLSVRTVAGNLVELDGGTALGFGPSSQLAKVGAYNAGSIALPSDARTEEVDPSVTLTITQTDGLASSTARVTAGDPSTIRVGDLFEMTKVVIPSEARLRIAIPVASSDDAKKSENLGIEIDKTSDITLVRDPVATPPTHLAYLTRGIWVVRDRTGKTISAGPELDAGKLRTIVSGFDKPKVFVNIPPSERILSLLQQRDVVANQSIEVEPALQDAQYILIGRRTDDLYSLSLVRGTVFGDLDPKSRVDNSGVICSTDSPLPLRTTWIEAKDGEESATVNALEGSLLLLGRLHAWLTLGARQTTDGADWPYHLSLTLKDNGEEIGDRFLKAGTEYDVHLVADPDVLSRSAVRPHYVYVFGVQCDGKGVLLYPPFAHGAEAPLPMVVGGSSIQATILLGTQKITPPLGRDTLFMLTSVDQVHNLEAFRSSAVLRGPAGDDPLGDLVRGLNGSFRGAGDTPATWGIQVRSIRSSPGP